MRSATRATTVVVFALAVAGPAAAQYKPAAEQAIEAPIVAPAPLPSAATLSTEAPAIPGAPAQATTPAPAPAPAAAATPTPAAPAAVAAAPAAPQPDPVVTAITERLKALASDRSVPKADREALETYYEAAEVRPVWTAAGGLSARAEAAMREIAAADDWGLRASDYTLPKRPVSGADAATLAEAEVTMALAVLEYARHARGGRMDPTDLSFNIDRQPPQIEPLRVLADAASAPNVDSYLRSLHPQHPQFELLRQKYLEARRAPEPQAEEPAQNPQSKGKTTAKKRAPEARLAQRILYNMEMWRWMPEDLGKLHVLANLPEYMKRVVKDGKVIHEERIIIGKIENQTPLFSDEMDHIVFHPYWGVPDSIKVKEIWPSLAGSGQVLNKYGLKIQRGGRDIDPRSVNWSSTDIRQFTVLQPPGPSNVLGVVKFMFPNKHQVYMHDTPTKNLFNSAQRTFSHGCMRVRNPVRFAEVILEQDKGWDAGRVGSLVKGGPQNNHIYLDRKIPVHVTYFTAVVGADGKLQTFPDVYGHEPKIQMGLDGKAHLIVKKKPTLTPPDAVTRLADTKQNYPIQNWMKQIFGNF